MGYGPWGRKESDTTSLMTSLVAQMVKHLSTMQETQVRSLGLEDTLEKEMAIHSSTLAWKIPWTAARQASLSIHHPLELAQTHPWIQ